jgi:uncharacterized membrane protein YphA (DoxX/SURF4 family)
MKFSLIFTWILRIVAAGIMLQTLYFKFTAQAESVYIFSALGIEPWGRIGTGIAELISGILILIPRTTLIGAIMGAGIMLGAIASHLLFLGIQIMKDGGGLFFSAMITLICCMILVFIYRKQIPMLLKFRLS